MWGVHSITVISTIDHLKLEANAHVVILMFRSSGTKIEYTLTGVASMFFGRDIGCLSHGES